MAETTTGNSELCSDTVDSIHEDSYTLEILNVIRDAQQQHGLRHGDHQRYRQYCARRLKRIRKTLHFPQGSKYKVQPKKITPEMLKDIKFLHIPLFESERAWSYAMQLKEEANTEPRKKFHLGGRLRKSVSHAEQLQVLCDSSRCDARTKLEAQAYCAFLKGSLHFEQEHWKTAIEHFSKAKTIYGKLGSALVDEMKDIYLQRVEEITPNIRYCAYNIGDESAINDLKQMRMKSGGGAGDVLTSRLDELIEKTREKQSVTFSEVTWRGRTVPVKTEQVRGTLLALQEMEKQLVEPSSGDSKLSYYERLLKDLIDAQQALREDLKDDQQFRSIIKGQDYEGKVPNSVYLHTYLCYLRQTKTVERNLLMVESMKLNLPGNRQDDSKKLTKPQDLARLYDIIIQNLSEIPSLPGLDEDTELAEEVQIRTQAFRAFRVYYVGLSYLNNKKWKEAIALFERTLECGQAALQGYRNRQVNQQEMLALEALMATVDGQKYSCRASSILDSEDVTDQMSALSVKERKMPLVERLDSYYEDPSLTGKKANLVQFPPDFAPIPCKPVFFDLANSLIEFPDLSDKVETKKQAGGIGGLVKGWLSWGGKK